MAQDTRSWRRCRLRRDFSTDPANYNACQPRAPCAFVVVCVECVLAGVFFVFSSVCVASWDAPAAPGWQSAKCYVPWLLFAKETVSYQKEEGAVESCDSSESCQCSESAGSFVYRSSFLRRWYKFLLAHYKLSSSSHPGQGYACVCVRVIRAHNVIVLHNTRHKQFFSLTRFSVVGSFLIRDRQQIWSFVLRPSSCVLCLWR